MKALLPCILLLITLSTYCQSVWYFGENAGVDFSTGTPTGILGGQIFGNEGVSAMSDCSDGLLFYCDGEKIWNKNHVIMPNGNGLMGHYSASQSSIIIPMPGDATKYYVFTTDAKEHLFANGVRYSIVDITLDGGLGDVTTKNQLLHPKSSEKMCATMHSNQTDVWLIWHHPFTDTIYSALIDPTGITLTDAYVFGPALGANSSLGQMKASQQGDKVAYVGVNPQLAVLVDFDNTTGSFSGGMTFPGTTFGNDGLYGVEFSSDGSKLYISNHSINYLATPGDLLQFDLSSGIPANIIASKTIVGHNVPPTDLRGLQIGPDDKIYASRNLGAHLGVVNNPNLAGGACNYVDTGLHLSGKTGGWGLPNFVSGERIDTNDGEFLAAFEFDDNPCVNQDLFIKNTSTGNYTNVSWSLNGTHISNAEHLLLNVKDTGVHSVLLRIGSGCQTDTATLKLDIGLCNCINDLFIPTAFSPNGDGENDTLYVRNHDFELTMFKIYDRWGKIVFSISDKKHGWDGLIGNQPAEPGVYVYRVAGRCHDSGKDVESYGHVTLMR